MQPTHPDRLPEWLRSAQERLTTDTLGHAIFYEARTGSTNAVAANWVRMGAPDGACIVTDDQHAGRGRAGRAWHAEPGANLTFSLIVRPRLSLAEWPFAGFAAAVAVARTLEVYAPGPSALVKWPNDVLLTGRKAAGLLLETVRSDGTSHALVVGIGLNVNQTTFPDGIADTATSLHRATGQLHDRAAVLSTLLNTLEQMLGLCAGAGVNLLLQLYTARLAGLGETVTFYESASSAPVRGRLTGLTPAGALRVETADGVRTFHAGDLTTHAA